MKIATKWNSGNFTLAHSAEVTEEQVPVLASLGLLYLAQRNREHDEVLGAYEKVDGKKKRKAGWKRNDVAYGATLAERLAATYAEFKLDGDEVLDVDTVVTEYIRDTVESKFTDERAVAEARESLPEAEFEKWLRGTLGFKGETHTADGDDYSREFLLAIRERKLAIQRAQMANI